MDFHAEHPQTARRFAVIIQNTWGKQGRKNSKEIKNRRSGVEILGRQNRAMFYSIIAILNATENLKRKGFMYAFILILLYHINLTGIAIADGV
jgi:hypothetical protein